MPESDLPVTVSVLAQRGDELLLVEERASDDVAPTWMLPGGRVEPGETPDGALRRELSEETGLAIVGEPLLAFEVMIEADLADLIGSWRAITYACEVEGALAPNDPDGLILAAEWVGREQAFGRLEVVEWYDSAPLRAFLAGSASPGARYGYRLSGQRGAATRSAVEIR